MEKFAVIDTETNWLDEVMSIGIVIANSDTFDACELKYYIICPECFLGGMFSNTLRIKFGFKCKQMECTRKEAIYDLIKLLKTNNVTKIFAYNATFDYRHLPELQSLFTWYDIMRLAAYKQYNPKINEADCYATGRLKRDYGVENIKKLLTGLNGEYHNALYDALDELNCIMKPLGHKLDKYIELYPKKQKVKNR